MIDFKFQVGDVVRSRIDGDVGEVIGVYDAFDDVTCCFASGDIGAYQARSLELVFRPTVTLPKNQFIVGDIVQNDDGEVFEVAYEHGPDEYTLYTPPNTRVWIRYNSAGLTLVYRRQK